MLHRGDSSFPSSNSDSNEESNALEESLQEPSHHIDISYFETQSALQKCQEEVEKLSSQKRRTQEILDHKLCTLQEAQLEYDVALRDHHNAQKALDEAQDKMSTIDLQMPGEFITSFDMSCMF